MSNKKIIVFIAIILILLIVALMFIFKRDDVDRLKNIYQNICNHQNFVFTMEEINDNFKYKVCMAQRGNDTSIDMYLDDEHSTTIILNKEEFYYIMHDEEEYQHYDNYEDDQVDTDMILYELENTIKNNYNTGKEEIAGKEYYYEEFNNDTSDFVIYADINEESIIKTRFYFEQDKLVYIKNIIINENKQEEELIKVNLEYKVDDNLFKIPDNYAEVEDSV